MTQAATPPEQLTLASEQTPPGPPGRVVRGWSRFGRKPVLLSLTLLLGCVLRAPFLIAPHREGDEHDVRALVTQLAHGEYSLRGARDIDHTRRRSAYVEAPLYHHPPLYYGLGWLAMRPGGELGLYLITYLASLAVLALTFLIGTRLRDPPTGFVAALIVMACPITQLVSGKIWAESFLTALLLALIYLTYCTEQAARASGPRDLCLGFALGCAITLTRQTGVFALGFLLPMLWCSSRPRQLRPMVIAASGGLVFGVLAWLSVTAWSTGQLLASAVQGNQPLGKVPGFVAMLLRRNPGSFLYVPLLLCPLYLFGLALVSQSGRGRADRLILPLTLFASGYALGLTLLAATRAISYHMKYLAPALPALALASAWQFVALARVRPRLFGLIGLGALAYAGPMLIQLTIELPKMAEVDPRFFYSVFDALPW